MPNCNLEKISEIAGKHCLLTQDLDVEITRIGSELTLRAESKEYYDNDPVPVDREVFFELEKEIPKALEDNEELKANICYDQINGYLTRKDFIPRRMIPSSERFMSGACVPMKIYYYLRVQFVHYTVKPEEPKVFRDEEILDV
ncbi:hypothetical protein KY340_00450 [Candidatus Woesearchaeota archaeon]|nr:hypothetical protein [Candidatus Woesearchaeota archaeon]